MAVRNNLGNYAAVKQSLCYKNDTISDELFKKLGVNRGLRDLNGKGVLTGLTTISAVISSKTQDGVTTPCDGELWYRGYNIRTLIDGIKENEFGFEKTAYLLLFGQLPTAEELKEFANSVNNGNQTISGGECEDYFREVVKKNNENKMSDCKKCGLHFGSVRCFDKNCPHNTPESYAVGLKDGKVIECGVNKEIVMNENKPLFKTGDVVKLKGCPDKNLFWIVMDVIEDGYIFNDGKKYSFDDQHHYEKSNREVINAPDITAKVTDKNHKMGPKSKLPSKYYEEIQTKRDIDKSEFIIKHMILPNKMDDKLEYEIIDGYEFDKVENGKIILKPIKPKYPKTYKECCDVLLIPPYYNLRYHTYEHCYNEFATSNNLLSLQDKLNTLGKLLICRDAYWKVAGEEMGLGKPWEPKFGKYILFSIKFYFYQDSFVLDKGEYSNTDNCILVFPTREIRDAFYDNFNHLIEQCKELL